MLKYCIALPLLFSGCVSTFGPLPNEPTPPPAGLRKVAVITHGFRLPWEPKEPPRWTFSLRHALLADGYDQVIVFDWAAESNDAAAGWTESAGDELFAAIMHQMLASEKPLDLHLIGYSRGTVVNSEAHRRLAWHCSRRDALRQRLARVHLTMLDPHPANRSAGFSGGPQYQSNALRVFERTAGDSNPQVWAGTNFAEVYFQRSEQADDAKDSVNLFGLGPSSYLGSQCDRFTDVSGQATHVTVGQWYLSKNHQGLAHFAESSEQNVPVPISSNEVNNDEAYRAPARVEPSVAPVVVNGDFAATGRVRSVLWSLCAENDRIPGWRCDTTKNRVCRGKVRLAASDCEAASVLVHNPMYFPPDAKSLRVDFGGTSGEGALTAYFVPAEPNAQGKLELISNKHAKRVLGRWELARLPKNVDSIAVQLPAFSEFGGTGSIAFGLTGVGEQVCSVWLGNVRFATVHNRALDGRICKGR